MSDELIVRIAEEVDWDAFIDECVERHLPFGIAAVLADRILEETADASLERLRQLMEQPPR